MRRARAGDGAAYDRCLRELAHALRPVVRRGLARAGKSLADTEDVVQDILIAVHLKRHTWDAGRPFEPWLYAIARHKLTDALRKRGSRVEVPIELFAETLPSEGEIEPRMAEDVTRSLEGLPRRQADVVRAIAIDGVSIAETAARLDISEGAVRVALHRGLAALTRRNRDDG
ncbi:MAG: sigma-70 family RNA polymerase sigma factor [Pseudorhodoplanes sp.]|nr:sigma-70 family RNA polymerase sigma factor [Pseudorhodoplanes sp.]